MYNKNEDFYAAISQKTTPEYDVLLTNPPYSGDHWDRLLDFGCYGADASGGAAGSGSSRPLLALMPDFIAERSGFKQRATEASKRWVFLGPKEKAYRFAAPTLAAVSPVGAFLLLCSTDMRNLSSCKASLLLVVGALRVHSP